MNVSYIIPTMNRPSLLRTLTSIRARPEDEIIVIGNVHEAQCGQVRYVPCAPGHDGGNKERNVAMRLATGTHLAFIDDDDFALPVARDAMQRAMEETPDVPVIFRMQYPCGIKLWTDPQVRCGNVGTPMIFVPNNPDKLGVWREGQHCGDYWFMTSIKWAHDEIVWRREIIAQVGHNPGEAPTDDVKLGRVRRI